MKKKKTEVTWHMRKYERTNVTQDKENRKQKKKQKTKNNSNFLPANGRNINRQNIIRMHYF